MINRFGGLSGLMMATQDDLLSVKGIGKAKMAQILAAMEIVKRRLRQPLEKINIIENPSDLFEYLKASMRNLFREEFRLLHLNRSKHLIAEEVLFRGTVDESTVYAREVVESALRRRASALIFVHNHPNTPAQFSPEDIELTKALIAACKAVDIPVLDHVITSRGDCVSLRQECPKFF
jgi:DNA repair protein RadC